MDIATVARFWMGLESRWKVAVIALCLALSYFTASVYNRLTRRYVYLNQRGLFEFSDGKAKQRYQLNARAILTAGLETVGFVPTTDTYLICEANNGQGNPFYINAGRGPVLVLPNRYAPEVYNNRQLNVSKGIGHDLHSQLPGTEGFQDEYFPDHFGVAVFKRKLRPSPSLNGLLEPMSPKTSNFLLDRLGNDGRTKSFHLSALVNDLIGHITAEMRSGAELARNAEWHRLCTSFTPNVFAAVADLDKWPESIQHIVHMALPSWERLRAEIEEARTIFAPVYRTRMIEKHQASLQGEKPVYRDDMLEWLDEGARGQPYDAFLAQLVNTQPFIAVTADLLTHVIVDICKRPQLQHELRREVQSAVADKHIPAGMLCDEFPLMDSVIKESLRIKLLYSTSVKRAAERRIVLSDGTLIPKGAMVAVSLDHLWDESVYPKAHEFRGDRFYRMRKESAPNNRVKLTSTGMEHMGFGLGHHACPGRFLAAAMMKIVLCHMLLKYDLGSVRRELGGNTVHQVEIQAKRRPESASI